MKYDFDEQISRRGTDSYKWDSAENENVLPMWVADMDFRTAPVIIDALHRRVEHGIFGYTRVPDSYYETVIDWFVHRHGWKMDREWIIYTSGVVPAVSAIIKALTVPGDKVLVQTPVYNCFFSSIRNNGREMVSSPLVFADHTYTIEYEDLERKAADPKIKVMLLCNPHNPAGRVWKREELVHIGEICIRHGVTVVSDEIHCELVFPGYCYTPFASISEDFLRHSVTGNDRANNDNEVCDVNPFGVIATQAAYNEGKEWLDQLIEYLHANYLYMRDFCREHLPEFPVTILEGTYLVWMDCRKLGISSEELERRLVTEARLWLNAGTMYGAEGEGFMRWNIACPRNTLTEGLKRFVHFVKKTSIDA